MDDPPQDDPNDIRPIPGHDGYFASADGRILSSRQGGRMKVLSASDVKGYPSVSLMVPGKRTGTRFYAHDLVCRAFHGPRPSRKHEVRHLDSDPLNRAQGNLRWGTRADQAADRARNGRGLGGPLCPRGAFTARGRGRNKTGAPPAELRPIPGCPGYLASSDGRIFTTKTKGGLPLEMSPSDDGHGNPRITLSSVEGRPSVIKRVCILVCSAFNGPPPASEGYEVLHGNHDTRDCSAANLRWGTSEENMRDRVRARTLHGERSGRAVLTEAAAAAAKAQLLAGSRVADVARLHGVNDTTIRNVRDGRTWGHVPPGPPCDPVPRAFHARPGRRGEANPVATIPEATAREILGRRLAGESIASLARTFGLSRFTVGDLCRGTTWGHLQAEFPTAPPAAAALRLSEAARIPPVKGSGGWGGISGGAHPAAKLTDDQVRDVIRRKLAGESSNGLASEYGVSKSAIDSAFAGKTYPHVRAEFPPAGPAARRPRGRPGLGPGRPHPMSKATEEIVLQIRSLAKQGWDIAKLARRFGISRPATGDIVRRKSWRHLPEVPGAPADGAPPERETAIEGEGN